MEEEEKVAEDIKFNISKLQELKKVLNEAEKDRIEKAVMSYFAQTHMILLSLFIASPILLIWISLQLWLKIFLTLFLIALSQFITQGILIKIITKK